MDRKAPGTTSFSPMALLGFLAVCLVLGWGIQTKSELLRIGLILLQVIWLVAGSVVVVSRWMNQRRQRK
ncbi:hypothetical protein [Dyella japonica]|uniref:hypothetical protein n=1 Tax=Dyella japonica TaxID=231455 RepID=UPI000A97B951|nr:hypothetical protein [Dyella japonica]